MKTNRLCKYIFSTVILFSMLSSLTRPPRPVLAGGPWYVRPDGNDTNDCLSPTSACATINAALQRAEPSQTIYIASGVYSGTGSEVVLINKNIYLSGGWDNNFTQQEGNTIVDGEITRGGITVGDYVNATIDRINIENSGSGSGYTEQGIGIYIDHYGSAILNDSVIKNYYKGIENWGHLTLNNSTISQNSMGGIYNYQELEINKSTIYKNNNVGPYGGGIMNGGNSLSINNSTISFNKAESYGGGIYSNSQPVTIYNSTITGNSTKEGGGIYGTNITIENSIISGNQAAQGPGCSGQIHSAGYNLLDNNSDCNFITTTGDLLNIDPLLGPIIGKPNSPQYHPLLPGSPAINAGNPIGCNGSQGLLNTDQRDAPRVGRCDMGAYEYTLPGSPAMVAIIQGSPQHVTTLTPYRIPFQVVVIDNIGTPVNGETVTFTAPIDGPSGSFADSESWQTVEETSESGVATPSVFTANALIGDFQLTASVGGVSAPAIFELSNSNGLYVSPIGDDRHRCLYPNETCSSIIIAIRKALAGDTIFVSNGTFTGRGGPVFRVDRDLYFSGGWDNTFTYRYGFSVVESSFRNNGILIYDVTAQIERFIIQNAEDDIFPGGILNHGNLTLNQVVVRNSQGNGIYNSKVLYVNNSSIVHNKWDGIYNWGGINYPGNIIVSNSGIINNNGTGITQMDNSGTNPITIQNSIIARNAEQQCSGEIISSGYNLISDSTGCNFISTEGDLLNVSDGLEGFVNVPGYYPLTPDSPAYNSGNPTGCLDNEENLLSFDLRGMPRFGRCDIGPYEFHPIDLFSLTFNPEVIDPGATATYTIVMPNITPEAIEVALMGEIPYGVDYVPDTLTATSGVTSIVNRTVTWTGVLPAGGVVMVSFNVKAKQPGLNTISTEFTIDGLTFLLSADLQVNTYRIKLPYIANHS